MIRVEFDPNTKFIPDFNRVALRENGSFEYFINQRLSLNFINLIMVTVKDGAIFTDLRDVIIKMELFEGSAKLIPSRIRLFKNHEEDKVKRFMKKQSRSVFFDSDEVSKLEELFQSYNFIADAILMYEGKEVEFINLSRVMQKQLTETMRECGLIYEMSFDEYRDHKNIVRYKKLVSKTQYGKGGVDLVSKNKLIAKTILGAALIGLGGLVVASGFLMSSKSMAALGGMVKEVILVENDVDDDI